MSRRPRLARNVVALGVVSLFTDVSSEVVYPLLPLFLTALGAGPAFVGLVEGIAETTASLLKLVAGWLSDRLRRRKALVVLGYGLSSATRPLMAMALAPVHVLVVRFTDRLGKGVRGAPRDALIADSTDPSIRGRAFGFHRAMDHLGAVIGPLIAFALLRTVFHEGSVPATAATYRLVFWAATVPAALAVLTLILFVREIPPPPPPGAGDDDTRPSPVTPGFRRFVIVTVLFTLGNSSDAFLLLRATDLGVGPAWIPLLWAVLHVVKSAGSMPGSGWSDRIGRRATLAIGWAIYAVVYAGFALATDGWQAWVLFAVYGVYFALTEGTEKAYVADLVVPAARSTAFGVLGVAVGVAALPASLVTGGLWQAYGAKPAFLLGGAMALLAAALLATLPEGRRLHRPRGV